MPQGPYLLSGKIYTSRGTVSNSRVIVNSDLSVLTDSSGQYVMDLANMDSGYTADATYTITAQDELNNEFVSDTITVSGQNQTKNLFLEPRIRNNDQTRGSEHISINNLGNNPVSEENPLPVSNQVKQYSEQLSYVGDLPEYHGYAAPGTASTDSRWRIRKLIYSGNNVVAILYANGSTNFEFVWNNRASYNYS